MDPIDDPYEYAKARNIANIRTNGAPSYDDDYMAAALNYSQNPTPENAWYADGTVLRYVGTTISWICILKTGLLNKDTI